MQNYDCYTKGLLSFQVMWLLSKKAMHGDELAGEIGRRRGDKPKAGTIYPALKDLSEKGLIKGRKQGKLVVYSLTAEGKRAVKITVMHFCRSFGDIFETRRRHGGV